jgi:hypothetical protein
MSLVRYGGRLALGYILQRTAHAVLHTRGWKAGRDASRTLVALPCDSCIRSEIDSTEGAREHTKTTLFARSFIHGNPAVFLLCDCAETTNGNTGGIVAMKARGENKILMEFSVNFPWADSDGRTPSRTRGEPVFLLARDFTRMTCNASIDVNQQKHFLHHLFF